MLAEAAFALIVVGATCYLLFGGADLGAGLWHLLAGRARPGAARGAGRTAGRTAEREVVEHAMGPLWEANHVWLIFVLVLSWTAFPPVFAAVSAASWVPLSLAALGIVVRGSAFAFRKAVPDPGWYAPAFAVASLLTPYCLGAVAGGVATGRLGTWWSPTAVYTGVLTTALCAYLAAVYLTADARRLAGPALAERFRHRALLTGCAVGALALAGPLVLRLDAPVLADALLGRALPVLALSAAAGFASLALLTWRRYVAVRVTAAAAVAAVLWGWVAARYPEITGSALTVHTAAASEAVLAAVLVALGVGAALLVPSFAWLYAMRFVQDPRAWPPEARSRSRGTES